MLRNVQNSYFKKRGRCNTFMFYQQWVYTYSWAWLSINRSVTPSGGENQTYLGREPQRHDTCN